jgi:hypothetical protein
LVGSDSAVDQHHCSQRVTILINKPAPEIEQDDGKILVNHTLRTEPVDQEPTILKAAQHALGVLLFPFMPEAPHRSKHGHGVFAKRFIDRRPFTPVSRFPLCGLPVLLGARRG